MHVTKSPVTGSDVTHPRWRLTSTSPCHQTRLWFLIEELKKGHINRSHVIGSDVMHVTKSHMTRSAVTFLPKTNLWKRIEKLARFYYIFWFTISPEPPLAENGSGCQWVVETWCLSMETNLYKESQQNLITRNCNKLRKIHSGQGHTSFANDFFHQIQISETFRFSLIHIRINRSLQSLSYDTLVTTMLL